jgi:hypothetical protein
VKGSRKVLGCGCASAIVRSRAEFPANALVLGNGLSVRTFGDYRVNPGCAMNAAQQPTPELYREAATKLRVLANQSPLPNIQGDLLDLAARFERMAAYFEAQRRMGADRDTRKI